MIYYTLSIVLKDVVLHQSERCCRARAHPSDPIYEVKLVDAIGRRFCRVCTKIKPVYDRTEV